MLLLYKVELPYIPSNEANAILFDGPNQSLWQIAITTTTLASFIT